MPSSRLARHLPAVWPSSWRLLALGRDVRVDVGLGHTLVLTEDDDELVIEIRAERPSLDVARHVVRNLRSVDAIEEVRGERGVRRFVGVAA